MWKIIARRQIAWTLFAAVLALAIFAGGECLFAQATQPAVKEHVDHPGLVKLAWQMACQTDTFKTVPFSRMIETLHPVNVHHIELDPGQMVSEEDHAIIGPEMAPAGLQAVLAKLQSVKMDVVSYGVADFTNDETQARKVFDFAAKFKAKNIVANASKDSLEMLDRLAQSYKINVAILNGPAPSAAVASDWSDPDVLAKAISDRSGRMGICADIAIWRRSGFSPAETIQKFPSRVMEIRLSDVNAAGQEVALGSGDAQMARALTWLKHQNFKGVCAIGYSSGDPKNRLNNWITSANAFSDVVTKLAAEK